MLHGCQHDYQYHVLEHTESSMRTLSLLPHKYTYGNLNTHQPQWGVAKASKWIGSPTPAQRR